jgi:hypothetical protein
MSRPGPGRRLRRFAAASVAGLLVAACGGGDDAPTAPGGADAAADEGGAAHIHGVGVNPADDAVIIATHTGLFRAPAGRQTAERIGDRRQDTMGFTVVGPDRFLGSGHPDLREDLPPLLGLIRSADAGRSWTPVSLLGEADFHVLRAAGRRIYGVNASDGRLLVSDDGGRGWASRTPPGPLLDVAIDPRDPDHVVAAAEDGLFRSRDAGSRWRPLEPGRTGLLAWGAAGLVLIEGDGTVHAGRDAGRTFEVVGRVEGQPAALAAHGDELLVALHDNSVHVSGDGGRTWKLRVSGGS